MQEKYKNKYTFMIIPFKNLSGGDGSFLEKNDFFSNVDIKYEKLYKHISAAVDNNNSNHSIYEKKVNLEKYFQNIYQKDIIFYLNEEKTNVKVNGIVNDILVYYFTSGIGFIVFDIHFDNKLMIEDYCEIVNKLKKIERKNITDTFTVKSGNKKIDFFDIFDDIERAMGVDLDFFFQYYSIKYVSATMLNSYTFLEDEKYDEKKILYYLECLKRSQTSRFGVSENGGTYIHPFKNVFFGFSSQGVGNINYVLDVNETFILNFYKSVRENYLLMTLILLNQEFTLLDYCIQFTKNVEEGNIKKETERLDNFKVKNVFSTPSHLEHFRSFYESLYKELGIGPLMIEVDEKQKSIYNEYNNEKQKEITIREKSIKFCITMITFMLSIFSVFGIVKEIYNLLQNNQKKILIIASVISVILILALLIVIIVCFSSKKGRKNE